MADNYNAKIDDNCLVKIFKSLDHSKNSNSNLFNEKFKEINIF